MLLRQGRTLEALRGARTWLAENATLVARSPGLDRKVDELSAIIDRIAAAMGEQELLRIAGLDRTIAISQLKRALRRYHMKPIVDVARAVATALQGLAADVRLPSRKATAEVLIGSAGAMAQALKPVNEVFVTAGMPPDFVEQLEAAAGDLARAVNERGMARSDRVGATAAIAALIRDGVRTLAVIDAVLTRELRNGPEAAAWASAKRIRQASKTTEGSAQDEEAA
jgi:hypothetical protein